eukprot:768677-Hanusia_phi.AAC.7
MSSTDRVHAMGSLGGIAIARCIGTLNCQAPVVQFDGNSTSTRFPPTLLTKLASDDKVHIAPSCPRSEAGLHISGDHFQLH